jgi:hypothetical protein
MGHRIKQILTVTCGLALSMGTASALNTGFYAGPMIGGSWIHTTNNVISGTDGSRLAHTKKKESAFLAGGIVGWGLRSVCLYGAFEFDGFYADISKNIIVDNEFTDERMSLKNKYQLGGGIRFGFVQTINSHVSVLPFARVGFQVGKYTRKYTVKDSGLSGGHYSKSASTNVFSVVPAIGAEFVIMQKYGIRIEGRYAPRFTHQLYTGTVPSIVAKFSNSTLYTAVSQRALLVSAIYHI